MRHGYVDKRAMITTTLTSSCHWKALAPFWLQKKRPEKAFFNTNSELFENLQKKLCHSKQQ